MTRKAVAKNGRTPKYTLRNIDPALWKAVKERVAFEGRTIDFVLKQLLRVYAKHGYHRVVETFLNGKDKL